MNDSIDGTDRAPDRYAKQERETIDRIRDLAVEVAQRLEHPELASALFMFWCEATALKYEDRNGAKGDGDADLRKAKFYHDMAVHVCNPSTTADPRARRAGYTPYFQRASARYHQGRPYPWHRVQGWPRDQACAGNQGLGSIRDHCQEQLQEYSDCDGGRGVLQVSAPVSLTPVTNGQDD